MADSTSANPGAPSPSADSPRSAARKPPAWVVVGFLALLAGGYVLSEMLSRSGPQIAWIENDLDAALRTAAQRNSRVFLYVYAAGEPTAKRNDLEIFTQRWAREPLARAVCVRVAADPANPAAYRVAARYGYDGKPLFLLLDASGARIGQPAEGALDERGFFTAIGQPLMRSVSPQP